MMFSPNEKTITEILKLYQKGKSTAEIAEQFHVSRSSVYRWIPPSICHFPSFAESESHVKENQNTA